MSALPPPDSARLTALDRHFRFGLSASELEEFAPAVEASLGASTAVEDLYRRSAPPAPQREWAPAAPERNRLGAWYVTTEIA
ncbi:amidase, partial [Rhodococcus oxybenzonivorans]|nr:amidase [Rhodococcus oxybenzonivorans]